MIQPSEALFGSSAAVRNHRRGRTAIGRNANICSILRSAERPSTLLFLIRGCRLRIGTVVAAQIDIFSFRGALFCDGQQARVCYGLAGWEVQMMGMSLSGKACPANVSDTALQQPMLPLEKWAFRASRIDLVSAADYLPVAGEGPLMADFVGKLGTGPKRHRELRLS